MKRHIFYLSLIALLGGLLLTGCAQVTQSPAQSNQTQPTEVTIPEVSPTSSVVDTSTVEPTPTPEPSPTLVGTPTTAPITINVAKGNGLDHELVFSIKNTGRYSGENGQPAWLGWGADNLTTAPDGSFWITDTPADPDRLLHYSPQGELLAVIAMRLGDRQYWARDLAVDASGVWVLDYISQPGLVLHLSLDGSLLAIYEIPEEFATFTQEGNVSPGLWHIPFADGGKVLLDGPVGIVEMTVTGGNVSFKQVKGYAIGGRIYNDVENGLMIDDLRVGMQFLQPNHFLNYAWLLGVAADGGFYVRVDEGNNDQGKSEPPDQFVRRYSSSGELLGIALLPLAELDQAYDVSLGPDGNVYAMYSRTNHSVEILRLHFATGAAPLLSPYTTVPQPSFIPLLPFGVSPATDVDAARESMLSFFTALAERRYDDAAPLFGGSYDVYTALDISLVPDQPGMTWQNICEMEFCLAVSDILDARQVAPDEYEFLVGFVTDNSIRFDYSICCGNFQPGPSMGWFVYSVKVQKVNDQWLVMGGPLPLP